MASSGTPITAYQGEDKSWTLTVQDNQNAPVTTYTDQAILEVTCWPGGDQALTFTPSATWIDAAAGTVKLSIAGALTLTLEPIEYQLLLAITAEDGTRKFALPPLALMAIAGTAVPIRAYCSLKDVLAVVPWIETIEGIDSRRVASFGDERVAASRWLDQQVMSRARDYVCGQARRHGPVEAVAGVTITEGFDAGPYYGESIYPEPTIQAQLDQIQGYLDADLLMLESDGGTLQRLTAYRACYEILDDQVGMQGDTPYQDLAARFHDRANALLWTWVARIDTDLDGIANLELVS